MLRLVMLSCSASRRPRNSGSVALRFTMRSLSVPLSSITGASSKVLQQFWRFPLTHERRLVIRQGERVRATQGADEHFTPSPGLRRHRLAQAWVRLADLPLAV